MDFSVAPQWHNHRAQKNSHDENLQARMLGMCPGCGHQTHEVRKGLFRGPRLIPLTVEGQVKMGRCLMCHPLTESDNEMSSISSALLKAIIEAGSEEEDNKEWPGEIQKGSHVRCVRQSYGGGSVEIGDIGVATKREPDGDYRVDFPRQDNWCGRPSDLEVDQVAEKVRPGAIVKFKSSVAEPAYGLGAFREDNILDSAAFVVKVMHDGDVKLNFGLNFDKGAGSCLFTAQLKEVEPVDPKTAHNHSWPPGPLQLGQAVRVPAHLDSPSTGWGSLDHDSVGYIRACRLIGCHTLYECDFPSTDGWKGKASDLEVDEVANRIRPGARVRVRKGVTPKGGWAGVTPRSVGTVRQIDYDGIPVLVAFPEHSNWKGLLSELEVTDYKGERLQDPDVRTCRGNHGLKRFVVLHNDSKLCDWCGKVFGAGTTMFGCRRCNTDACESCHMLSEGSASTEESSPSVFSVDDMSVTEMKGYLGRKGFSSTGIVEKNDLRKLVWEAHVNDLVGSDLDNFMRVNGIDFEPGWTTKKKRQVAEDAYAPDYVEEPNVPVAYVVPMFQTGQIVELTGLKKASMNGVHVSVVAGDLDNFGRISVKTIGGDGEPSKLFRVKPENLNSMEEELD